MTTIAEALIPAAETFGDAEAVVDGNVRSSWSQLLDKVRAAVRFYILVVRTPGAALGADVIAYGRERLATCNVPCRVEFVATLPRKLSGKVLEMVLREEYVHV